MSRCPFLRGMHSMHRNFSMHWILIMHMLLSMHRFLSNLEDLSIWILKHMGFLNLWWKKLEIGFNLHILLATSFYSFIFLISGINTNSPLNHSDGKPFAYVLILLITNFHSKVTKNLVRRAPYDRARLLWFCTLAISLSMM